MNGKLDIHIEMIYNHYNFVIFTNNMTSVEYITSAIKKSGMRLTPQRMAICKLLSETAVHPTAAMIHKEVRNQYPSLSLMTVYNTLNRLVYLGLVNSLGAAGDNNIHYDGNISDHVNLACISCHKIEDIDINDIKNIENEVSVVSGYKILGFRMMYYGLCPDCQKTKLLSSDNQLPLNI